MTRPNLLAAIAVVLIFVVFNIAEGRLSVLTWAASSHVQEDFE